MKTWKASELVGQKGYVESGVNDLIRLYPMEVFADCGSECVDEENAKRWSDQVFEGPDLIAKMKELGYTIIDDLPAGEPADPQPAPVAPLPVNTGAWGFTDELTKGRNMNSISIALDLPDKKLHPNGGSRWNVRWLARIKREAHKYAWAIAYRDIGKLDWDRVRISYVFYLKPGSAKLADEDNLVAWMKKYQDGIAEAVGINDKRFTLGSVIVTSDKELPRVVITLSRVEGGGE